MVAEGMFLWLKVEEVLMEVASEICPRESEQVNIQNSEHQVGMAFGNSSRLEKGVRYICGQCGECTHTLIAYDIAKILYLIVTPLGLRAFLVPNGDVSPLLFFQL